MTIAWKWITDLSRSMFVCTAKLNEYPRAAIGWEWRIIRVPGYTEDEKLQCVPSDCLLLNR